MYQNIKGKHHDVMFLDQIILLLMRRAYIHLIERKIMTARKILVDVKLFLKMIENGKIGFSTDYKEREGCPAIPFCILKQKYLMMKGLLANEFGKTDIAVKKYIKLLNYGHILKPRLYKEALCLLKDALLKS